jgi:hypothetical protein
LFLLQTVEKNSSASLRSIDSPQRSKRLECWIDGVME